MATERLSTTTPTIEAGHSPILAMHARYEQALENHESADRASLMPNTPENQPARLVYDRAMEAINAETDALRLAILYQVPTTPAEAMVLQYHVIEGLDMVVNTTIKNEADEAAVTVAVSTLFDFLASEDQQTDHEALGKSFKRATMRAYNARRFRTGEVEA